MQLIIAYALLRNLRKRHCKDTKKYRNGRKKQANSYESVMKDLKAQIYFPVYILMGDESFYIDKLCDYITENVLQPEEKDFNQVILFGADTTASQVVDQCKGYPMMAEHRVVILKEAQNLKNFDAIEKYFENPVKSTIFVMSYKNGSIDRRKSWFRAPNKLVWSLKEKTQRLSIAWFYRNLYETAEGNHRTEGHPDGG